MDEGLDDADGRDEVLAAAARHGDSEAFGSLHERLRPDVERLCGRMLGSADAEDAASEVFVRLPSALESYDAARSFRPWLMTIAARLSIDRLRRRKVEALIFAPGELSEEGLAAKGASPLAGALRNEERAAVQRAVEDLPERFRIPLVLRYYADLDYATIAVLLDVKRDQVGVLLLRARRRLRKRLRNAAVETGDRR